MTLAEAREPVLDLDEIDRDIALLKLTDVAGISLEYLPEKLTMMATCIRAQNREIERLNQELAENSKRAQLLHNAIKELTLEIAEKGALLKAAPPLRE